MKTIYQPPQIADDEDVEALVTKYMTDYRRVYIEHPRVRYDGVYIAVCHYMYVLWSSMSHICIEDTPIAHCSRNGIGENVWVNVRTPEEGKRSPAVRCLPVPSAVQPSNNILPIPVSSIL